MAKNNINITLGVDKSKLEKGFNEAVKVTQQAASDIEKEAAKMALKVTTAIDKMSPKSQMRQLSNLALQMKQMGMDGTQAFEQVARSAGRLKGDIDEINALVKAHDPGTPFQSLARTLGGVAQGFAGVQGAMALVGVEGEEIQKTLLKVQGAMALAQGITALDDVKEGFEQLNLVMKANPILAGVTIGAAILVAFAAITDQTDELTKANERLTAVNNKAIDSYAAEEAQLTRLHSELERGNLTAEEKKRIYQQLAEIAPDTFKDLDMQRTAEQDVAAAIMTQIQLIRERAKAKAAENLYIEAYTKMLKAQEAFMQRTASGQGDTYLQQLTGNSIDDLAAAIGEAGKEVQAYDDMWKDAENSVNAVAASIKKIPLFYKATPTATKPTASGGGSKLATGAEKSDFTGFYNNLTKPFAGVGSTGIKSETFSTAINGFNQLTLSANNYSNALNKVQISAEELQAFLINQVSGAIVSMADAFGQAIASGENFAAAIGQSLLASMANFMKDLGKMFITLGVQKQLADLGLITVGGGVGTIAAGAALVAAGSAMAANLQKKNAPRAFADGGIIYGPTLGLMGEYAGAASNPEVVAPLDKLRSLIQPSGGMMQMSHRIDGRDLWILVDKAGKDMNRG